MSARKPLHPDCTGGVFCPVGGHVTVVRRSTGNTEIKHIRLTRGQEQTLRERRAAAKEVRDV